METLIAPRKLVRNPDFEKQKQKSLAYLSDDMIDSPIIEIINNLNKLSYLFTLQCCYGHFLYNGQRDITILNPSAQSKYECEVQNCLYCPVY